MQCMLKAWVYFCRSCAEEALQKIHGTVIGLQTVRLSWGRSPVKTQVSVVASFIDLRLLHW